MAAQDHRGTHDSVAQQRLHEIVTDVRIAMVTTEGDDGTWHSRPMYLQEAEDSGNLWFATSQSSPLATQVRSDARIIATFASPSDNRFAVVRGTASVHRDPGKTEELWTPAMQAWFPDGPHDPSIVLIRVAAKHGDYWDAPSKPVQVVRYLGAVLTGTRPDGGERKHVDLS